jgi:ferredoxin
MQAVSLGTAYIVQSSASELDTIVQSVEKAAHWQGPSLFSIYAGSDTSIDALDVYLTSAIALESRAFPTFEFDPSKREWADRFSVSDNPTVDLPWGQEDSEVGAGHDHQVMTVSFTFADFLSCDKRYLGEFRAVAPESWHPAMCSLDEYLSRDPVDTRTNTVPFVWMADETGLLHRVVVTNKVVDAAMRVQSRWNVLQELGGVTSSHAARLVKEATERLELEKLEAIEQAKQQHQKELERTTGEVAREIVSNIAASLLGLQATAPRAATSGGPGFAMPVATAAPDTMTEETVSEAVPADTVEPETEDDDDDVISMDEAYIETVRCTTCNECTNINSRMFAYNENQQAYIKDVTAGSFHELVVAAEMCPVKIIHPGKPLNPDEPRLSDLIERAKPYR